MDERLIKHLEEHLAAIEAGDTVESCLARRPSEADELASLLRIALALRDMPQPPPSPLTSRTAKTQFLSKARQCRKLAEPAPDRSRLKNVYGRLVRRLSMLAWTTPARAFTTAALSLALVLLIGGSVIYAADDSLPGDHLYGFKLLGEDVRRALTFGHENRIRLDEALIARRRDEVRGLLAIGRQEEVTFGGLLQERSETNWLIDGIPVTVDQETRVKAEPTEFAFVEIRGIIQIDGTVLAQLVEIAGDEIIGRVEAIRQDQWHVAGLTIKVDATTYLEDQAQVGDCVEVHTRRLPDGTLLALEIEQFRECQDIAPEDGDAALNGIPTSTPDANAMHSLTDEPENRDEKAEPTATIQPQPKATMPPIAPSRPVTDEPEDEDGDDGAHEGVNGEENSDVAEGGSDAAPDFGDSVSDDGDDQEGPQGGDDPSDADGGSSDEPENGDGDGQDNGAGDNGENDEDADDGAADDDHDDDGGGGDSGDDGDASDHSDEDHGSGGSDDAEEDSDGSDDSGGG